MHDSIPPKRLTRARRARTLAAAALVNGVLVAGCGGGGPASPTVAAVNSTTSPTSSAVSAGAATTSGSRTATTPASSTASSDGAADSGPSTPAALASAALVFSQCMRSNGVPNFPDPQAGGGFLFQRGAGIDPSSAVFKAAQAKCRKLLPGGGPPGPGAQTDPSPQALARMVKAAQCMRRHGIDDFPDPRTSVPSNLAGIHDVSDIDGVILVFPATIDEQAPLFTRAAAAWSFPLHNH